MRTSTLVLTAATAASLLLFGAVSADPPTNDLAPAAPASPQPPTEVATASVKLEISAEGQATLPANSHVEWTGAESACNGISGTRNLQSSGATPVSLPICQVTLRVCIPNFDTKQGTLDVAANKDRLG